MWQSSLYKNPFMDLPVGHARGDAVLSHATKICLINFSTQNTVVGRKARPELENRSRYRTSPWQSSLRRNLFVALQVENPRRDAVASDHL
jgi:hypothetical protein